MNSYILKYDLGESMQNGEGQLTFDESANIISRFDGVELVSVSADQVKEALVIAGVGCGLIFLKLKDETEQVLCRFTMSSLKPAGEFCKLITFYTQTGEVVLPEEKEARVCEKCGRPLVEGMNVCLFCYNKMGVIKRALKLMRPQMRVLIISQVISLMSSVLYLIVPVLNRYLIDTHLTPRIGPSQSIFIIAGFMLLARGLGEVLYILGSRAFNRASVAFANNLRSTAYDKLQKLSLNSLSKRTPGELIRRITDDTFTIKDFLTNDSRWMIEQVVMFIIVIIILLFTDVTLTLLVFIPVPIAMFALTRMWRYIHVRYERQWRKNSKCQSILHDIIKGIRTVKSFGNEKAEIKKFADANKDLATVSESNERMWATLFPSITFFTGIGEFLVLFVAGRAIVEGTLTLGVLTQFTMFIGYIYGPLRWMVSFPRWLADALTSMIKVFEIIDEEPDITGKPDAVEVPLDGGVSFEGVTFGYKSYEPVLKDVSLEIKPGEMVGIVGRSGVGKSTLINLVMRLYDPNIGSVKINGADLRDMTPEYLHENIGVVFQDSFLFAGTIYDNILYAKPDATPDDVIAAAKAANAHDFIMATADGYNTLIGESGYSISGGERQRLAIARAIIKNPSILILDEATSSLDVETELAIQQSLDMLTQGRTTIAIAHRLSTLRSADRLVVLDAGKVAEVGSHVELLKKKGIYYKLVMAQRQTSKMADEDEAG